MQISRGNNSHADSLATLASLVANPFSRIVSVELLPFSSVIPLGKDLILSIQPSISWIDPMLPTSKTGLFPRIGKRLNELDISPHGIGCLKKGSYIKGHIRVPICCVCTPRQLKYFWRNYMKEYVEVIREEGNWLTKPLGVLVAKHAKTSIGVL